MDKQYWITIYTDGSYRDGVAGYGYWIKSSRGRFKTCGATTVPLDIRHQGANYAEVYAATTALARALREHNDIDVTGVLFNIDSTFAINTLKYQARPCRINHIKNLQRRFKNMVPDGMMIRIKHVKAHTLGNDVRTYLNARCDEMARHARVSMAA